LHTAIADFLDPKIKALEYEIATLREPTSGSSGNQAGELVDFQDELKALRAELERVIKLPWKPNLNDGVLITAAPLWKLFRLIKWQKTESVLGSTRGGRLRLGAPCLQHLVSAR
jgi:hypothetical protein